MTPAMLRLTGLTKSFPGVVAAADVSFDVAPGEIHALLGENGAGKSTVVKMIYGALQPDAGTMWLAGRPHAPSSPAAARAAGVGMVFQHFTLFDALSVAENVMLGLEAGRSTATVATEIGRVAKSYGLDVDPRRLAGTLSVGERQRVEIVRCLMQSPKLLIMDEPTSVLTPQEAETMFATLRRLRAEGRSILYISHKLEEIVALCDRVTILRQGRVSGACDPRHATPRQLAELMLGDELAVPQSSHDHRRGETSLELRGLTLASDHTFGTDLTGISLDLGSGEIVGIAGVAGNGQTELMEALIGERPVEPGMIRAVGRDVSRLGPSSRRKLGLAFVPEERLGHAAVPGFSLWENTLLTSDATAGRSLDVRAAKAKAAAVVAKFGVKTPGIDHTASSLSGGNLQKFSVGREVIKEPAVLVVAQPTWGVDAGAAAEIQQALIALAERGSAVLVISQDLSELLAICDRIAVISGGRLTAPVAVRDLTIESLGRAMGGGGDMVPAGEVVADAGA